MSWCGVILACIHTTRQGTSPLSSSHWVTSTPPHFLSPSKSHCSVCESLKICEILSPLQRDRFSVLISWNVSHYFPIWDLLLTIWPILLAALTLFQWNIFLSTNSNCHQDIHKCWHKCHLGKEINFLLWHLISWNISLPSSKVNITFARALKFIQSLSLLSVTLFQS